MAKTKKGIEVIKDPEQFAAMTSDEIAVLIRENLDMAICGDKVGVDRHIIRFSNERDYFSYVNPYGKINGGHE